MTIFRPLMLKHHKEIAGNGHQLPGEHEGKGIGGQQHQQHATEEESGERCQRADTLLSANIFTDISGAVTGGDKGDETDNKEEKPGKRIEIQGNVQPGKADGQHNKLVRPCQQCHAATPGSGQTGKPEQEKRQSALKIRPVQKNQRQDCRE